MARKSDWTATFADGTTVTVRAKSQRMAEAKAMSDVRTTRPPIHLRLAGPTRDQKRQRNERQHHTSSRFDWSW